MIQDNLLLIANANEAYIYKYIEQGASLELKESFSNDFDYSSELVSDRPGVKSAGGKATHNMDALSSEHSPADQAELEFVQQLVKSVDTARKDSRLSTLDIAASPEMLGLLRENMDQQLAKKVDRTINKNLSGMSEREILDQIRSAH